MRVRSNASGQAFLTVRVAARPLLECQRCLEPFEWPIDASVRLQVVAESALDADSHEPDAEQDMIERIAGSHRLDVLALIKDELVLSLPYVPKPDVCPSLSRSEEHTSELQSLMRISYAVFCLKKTTKKTTNTST